VGSQRYHQGYPATTRNIMNGECRVIRSKVQIDSIVTLMIRFRGNILL